MLGDVHLKISLIELNPPLQLVEVIAISHGIANLVHQSPHCFVSGIALALASFSKIGFYKLPEKVNLRVLNLLSRSASNLKAEPLQLEKNLLLTLGGWDVF
ncbi:MAG: hypothetical protein K9G46_07585 [Flavobacteriales bacterium]|nr:hypothetical protein [Flavobacteriales bacterium]